jgi:hypothetical protein
MSSDLNRREVLQGAVMAPALFVSHGSPLVALETDAYPQALKALGEGLGPVRAVVVVSAHWETLNAVHVTAAEAPPLIHDFGGFPEPLYQLKYPSPGAPELARTLVARLEAAGLKAVADPTRGGSPGNSRRAISWAYSPGRAHRTPGSRIQAPSTCFRSSSFSVRPSPRTGSPPCSRASITQPCPCAASCCVDEARQ